MEYARTRILQAHSVNDIVEHTSRSPGNCKVLYIWRSLTDELGAHYQHKKCLKYVNIDFLFDAAASMTITYNQHISCTDS